MVTFSRLIKGKVSIYRKTTLLENGKFDLGNGSSQGRKKCFQAQYTIEKSKDWWSLLNHNLNSSHNFSFPLKFKEGNMFVFLPQKVYFPTAHSNRKLHVSFVAYLMEKQGCPMLEKQIICKLCFSWTKSYSLGSKDRVGSYSKSPN